MWGARGAVAAATAVALMGAPAAALFGWGSGGGGGEEKRVPIQSDRYSCESTGCSALNVASGWE